MACWADGLLCCRVGLFSRWIVGLIGCWLQCSFVGLIMGCWADGLFGCWVVGLMAGWAVGLGCWGKGLLGGWAVRLGCWAVWLGC